MLKKKNMAMIMAGVTVATSVAPAFATGVNSGVVANDKSIVYTVNAKNAEKVVAEVKKALETRFNVVEMEKNSALLGESVYKITAGGAAIKSHTVLEKKIKDLQPGETLEVTIQDQGHQVIDNNVVDYETKKFETVKEIKDEVAKNNQLTSTLKGNNTVEVKKGEDVVGEYKVGDDVVDFNDPITDKEDKITGFEVKKFDIDNGELYTINVRNSEDIDASTLVDGYFLTAEGKKLADRINEEKANKNTVEIVDSAEDAGFHTGFDIVIKNADSKVVGLIYITGANPIDINASKVLLQEVITGTKKVDSLAGDSRYTTAIEISKETFKNPADAKAVVLVGQGAIVDGLAAAPLAAQEKAPILLAKQNELTKETEAEMLRILGDDLAGKTIYIVGGESQISKELETKLGKLGVKSVERLSGDTRYETSLAIAKKLTNADEKAFVVGGKGEADAMSISAKAAELNAPIVVTAKDSLTKEATELLTGKNIEVIGGTSSVAESVEAKLQSIDKDKSVVRLAGETRKDTNAKVINAHYTSAEVKEAFVAKDGNAMLIDALSAAPLAASKKAPIILATNELSKTQETAIETKLTKVEKLTQIGNGVASSVVEKIVDILGLFI